MDGSSGFSPGSDGRATELLGRLESLDIGKPHRRIRLQAGLGAAFDSIDLGTLAFILPAAVAAWHLSSGQAGFLSSSALIGSLIGGLIAGFAGDAFGRRRVLMYALGMFCIGSLFGAIAPNWEVLLLTRVVTGIGCGAESAILAVYVSEFVAARFRGRYVGSLVVFFAIGYVVVATLATAVVPLHNGWRWLQVLGVLPVLMLLRWRRTLPETPRWLLLKGRVADAESVVELFEKGSPRAATKAPVPAVVTPTAVSRQAGRLEVIGSLFVRPLLRVTLTTLVIWFIAYFCYYGFMTWIPSLLIGRGFTVTKSFSFTILIYLAQIPGQYLAARLFSRFDQKTVFTAYMVCGALAAFLLSRADTVTWIVAASAATSFFMSGVTCCTFSYTPPLFPTAVRSLGYGSCYAFGRVGSVIAPIAIGMSFPTIGFAGVFGAFMVLLVVGALVMLVFGTTTRNRTLEQLENEAFGEPAGSSAPSRTEVA